MAGVAPGSPSRAEHPGARRAVSFPLIDNQPYPNIREAPLEASGRLGNPGSVSKRVQEGAMKTVSGEDSELIQAHPLRLLGQQPRVEVVGVATAEERPSGRSWPTRPTRRSPSLLPGSGLRVLEWIREARCGVPSKPVQAGKRAPRSRRRRRGAGDARGADAGGAAGAQSPRTAHRGLPLSSPAVRSPRRGRWNPCRTARCRGRSSGRRPTRTGSAGRPSHKSPSRSAEGWRSTSPR